MISLPIDSFLPEITGQLRKPGCIVVVAEPGAGKTTRVPPAILGAGLLSREHPNLVMLQPRRVAARAAAQRIGEENDWKLGEEIGYQIRFEKRIGPQTRLRVLTEGILTRQLLADPFLEGIGCVVLDEFHERSLHSDLAIAMLREMQQTVRPDLKIVVMSATIEAQTVAKFLGNCSIVSVPGRTFPVEIEYQPFGHRPMIERVTAAIEGQISGSADGGDILVFLPGAEEIRRVHRNIEPLAGERDLAVFPLHGSLPAEQQFAALRPSGKRKVILSTNIAETSLTIDGVTVVIDSGLARVPMFDPQRGLDHLELKQISQASAKQRAGRAGRTRAGRCVRLWSAKDQAAMEEFESPEIQRVDLSGAILDVHAWGKSRASDFGWFEWPSEAGIESAERLLGMLGALDEKGLTGIGRKLVDLPVHPRVGRLLLAAAQAGCPDQGAGLAALLSDRDVLRSESRERVPATQGNSDLLLRLEMLESNRSERLDAMAARTAMQAKEQLQTLARRLGRQSPKAVSEQTLLKLVLYAYPDRVCRRRGSDPSTAVMVGGSGVRLAAESIVTRAEFFVALDARHDPRSASRESMVRMASAIEMDWLPELFPEAVTREKKLGFDEAKEKVVGSTVLRYRDLVLSEDRDAAVDPAEAGELLARAIRARAGEIFRGDPKAAAFLARVELARKWMGEHSWPELGDAELGVILAELCKGKRSVEEVMRGSLVDALEGRLGYPLDRVLREQLPESLEVPSGSRIAVVYSAGSPPTLAVRLQEVFGWTDTPKIANGRLPILLHLLGPNYRVVQITDDLRSFWAGTYFQVRKDLRVRYPRHSWPEEPLKAKAVAKGGRKRG